MNRFETGSVISDAVRSPAGIKRGQMIGMRADDLAAQTIKALLARNSQLPMESNFGASTLYSRINLRSC